MNKSKVKDILYKIFIKYQLLLVLLLAIDQISKRLAVHFLKGGKIVKIIGDFFTLELTYNSGIAFSLLKNAPGWILASISIIACIALEYYLIKKKPDDKILNIGIICLIAGALGNGIDRWLMVFGVYKGVIDFFATDYFAVFNVADIYVTVTCIGLLIYAIFGHDDSEPSYKELKEAKKKLEQEQSSEETNNEESQSTSN